VINDGSAIPRDEDNPFEPLSYYHSDIVSPNRCTKHKMRPVVADVPCCVCVCVLDTAVSRAKTDESMEMLFGCVLGQLQVTMWAPTPPPPGEGQFGGSLRSRPIGNTRRE